MKYLITVIFLLISTVSIAQDKIDIIIVKKSERILYAVKDDKIIKKYDIAIGQNPEGHKLKEGDKKTPEGYYFIDGKNPKVNFFYRYICPIQIFMIKKLLKKTTLTPEATLQFMACHHYLSFLSIYIMVQIGQMVV